MVGCLMCIGFRRVNWEVHGYKQVVSSGWVARYRANDVIGGGV